MSLFGRVNIVSGVGLLAGPSSSSVSSFSRYAVQKAYFSNQVGGSQRLKDKVCIVTGGGAGIGFGIAKLFAAEGGKVVIADLNIEAAQKAATQLTSQGWTAIPVKTDITNEEQVKATVKAAVDKWGCLDVIVSNAGFQKIDAVEDVSIDNWKKMMSVHLDGSFLCTKYAVQQMKINNRGGSIIYMGSVHSKVASKLKSPYISAKHGLLGLTRAVAKEAAPYNIRSNLICPGFVLTDLVRKQIPEQAKLLNISEEEVVKNVMLKDTVDGQFTSIEDVAEVATFLASFPSLSLTGQSLIVSHGWVME